MRQSAATCFRRVPVGSRFMLGLTMWTKISETEACSSTRRQTFLPDEIVQT